MITRVLLVAGTSDAAVAQQLAVLPSRQRLEVALATGGPVGLSAAIERAADSGAAVAVISTALAAADEVLLRLLDDPALRIAALVGTNAPGSGVATQGSTVLSVGTALHPVPDADAGFLGALYIASPVVARAAVTLRDWAPTAESELLDSALVALARDAGLPMLAAVRPEPFVAELAHTPAHVDDARAAIAADADPQRAARTAARPGDGVYSTFVLRRLSRRLTPWAVRRGVSADTITATSAVLGLAGGGCFALGSYPALVAGAVLLQVSLVLDCVDGEIARATRTGSVFGAWLDAVTDRVKEYAALAGLALAGHHLWLLALAAMTVQTARHLQDFAFDKGVLAEWRAGMRDTRPLTDTTAWQRPVGAGRGPDLLTGSPSVWARRLIRMPIGERWLILCLAALADRPWLGLAAYLAAAAVAESWALLGAVRRTRGAVGRYSAGLRAGLAQYRDDGLLRFGAPDGLLGWSTPPLTALLEGGTLFGCAHLVAPHWGAAAFGWFAVVAWHRYDLAYRRGGTVPAVPRAVARLGLGWLVRIAVLVAATLAGLLPATLVVGSCWFTLVYVPESVRAGLQSLRVRSASSAQEAA